jgi:hypothetical protein
MADFAALFACTVESLKKIDMTTLGDLKMPFFGCNCSLKTWS